MNNCWKMTPKDRANMRQIQGELNRLQGNQKVMDECEKFMELEDWKTEIAKQEKSVEVTWLTIIYFSKLQFRKCEKILKKEENSWKFVKKH